MFKWGEFLSSLGGGPMHPLRFGRERVQEAEVATQRRPNPSGFEKQAARVIFTLAGIPEMITPPTIK